jgi:HD-like signal output (HDOD) protein
MKIPTKMLTVTVTIGILGLAGVGSLAYANQGKSVTAVSQNHQMATVSDGDGEANDDGK